MRKVLAICVTSAVAAAILGCQPTYVAQQPMAPSAQVMASTCTNNQGMVVEDQYCDPTYIAQQQMIARQQNNQALLNSLLLYHMIYSSEPYVIGAYARPGSYYTYAPHGYTIQPRRTYVTNVTNHTIIVNNGKATVAQPKRSYTPSTNTSARTATSTTSTSPRSYTPSASKSYTPSSPSRSYSAPSSTSSRSYSSGSSSSGSRRR